jgi:hypothetical protein
VNIQTSNRIGGKFWIGVSLLLPFGILESMI